MNEPYTEKKPISVPILSRAGTNGETDEVIVMRKKDAIELLKTLKGIQRRLQAFL